MLLLFVPGDPRDHNFGYAAEILKRLAGTNDARGRRIGVIPFDVIGPAMAGPHSVEVSYLNSTVTWPTARWSSRWPEGRPDELALARLKDAFPDRAVVGVPGATLS